MHGYLEPYSRSFDATLFTSGMVTSGDLGEAVVFSGNIASGQIGTDHIADGTIINVDIASGAVLSGNIASGQIGRFHIASGRLEGFELGSGSIVSGRIASGQVGFRHLADSSVQSGSLASGQVFTFHIASGGLLSGSFGSGQIGQDHLGSGAIVSGALASGQIGSFHIASGGVLSGNIASGQIGANHLAAGTIAGGIGSGAIVSGMIASGQLGSWHHGSGTIIDVAQYTAPVVSGINRAPAILTEEAVSGVRAVCISQSGQIRIAMASVSGRMPAIGVVVDNVLSGLPVNIYTHGAFQFTSGLADYSGYLGKPVWVGRSGQIVTWSGSFNSGGLNTASGGDFIQRAGVCFNSGAVVVNVVLDMAQTQLLGVTAITDVDNRQFGV